MARILVVEDDEQLRSFLVSALEWRGFTVYAAGGGDEGLELFREHGADLVFCDIHLPGMNGLQTIEKIASAPDAPKIVLMSGAHDKDATLPGAALRYENVRTLDKPFHVDAVLELLTELLGSSSG